MDLQFLTTCSAVRQLTRALLSLGLACKIGRSDIYPCRLDGTQIIRNPYVDREALGVSAELGKRATAPHRATGELGGWWVLQLARSDTSWRIVAWRTA